MAWEKIQQVLNTITSDKIRTLATTLINKMRLPYLGGVGEPELTRLAGNLASMAEFEDEDRLLRALQWAVKRDYVTYGEIYERVTGTKKLKEQMTKEALERSIREKIDTAEEYIRTLPSHSEFPGTVKFKDITLPDNPDENWFREVANKLFPPDYWKLWSWLKRKGWDPVKLSQVWQEWEHEKFTKEEEK